MEMDGVLANESMVSNEDQTRLTIARYFATGTKCKVRGDACMEMQGCGTALGPNEGVVDLGRSHKLMQFPINCTSFIPLNSHFYQMPKVRLATYSCIASPSQNPHPILPESPSYAPACSTSYEVTRLFFPYPTSPPLRSGYSGRRDS